MLLRICEGWGMTETLPKRIQRKRTKGWKMPPNTVYVGRPSKWGNPFTERVWGLDLALKLFRDAANGTWCPSTLPSNFEDWQFNDAHYNGSVWRGDLGRHPLELIREELRGKDLACWCPLDQPCHADVLLEIANSEATR